MVENAFLIEITNKKMENSAITDWAVADTYANKTNSLPF